MGSNIVTANTTEQTVGIAPTTGLIKIKKIIVNHRGTNLVELSFQDSFTTTASNTSAGVPVASATPVEDRLKISVVPGTLYESDGDMEGLIFMSTCQVDSDVTDADCDITVIW